MCDLGVELVDGLMHHPMIGVLFLRRKISTAIWLSIERFRPTQTRIDPAEFGAVLEQLDLELRVVALEPGNTAKAVRVSAVEKLQRARNFLGLLWCRRGQNDVMIPVHPERWMPRARDELPCGNA